MSQARYILVGGFPGAGKTAALAALARRLHGAGRRVAAIANDHGSELADAAALRAEGFPVEEITGGALGCRFGALAAVLKKLESADVVLAEAVGTAVDLTAGVLQPLRQVDPEGVAPLSVVVDPDRADQVLGLDAGPALPAKLAYLYRKQVEEADILVVASAGPLGEERLERLRTALAAVNPAAGIVALSIDDGQGLDAWIACLESGTPTPRPPLDLDYGAYAEAAALVGWLNATIEFTLRQPAGAGAVLQSIGNHLRAALEGVDVLHLKIALRADNPDQLGLLDLTGNGAPRVVRAFDESLDFGELIVNLRAETHPEKLHTALRAAVVEVAREFPGMLTEFAHLHYFKPNKPESPRL